MGGSNRVYMIQLRAEWRREGICTRCGKWPAMAGGTRCDDCRQYDNARNRKSRLSGLAEAEYPRRIVHAQT